MKNILLFLSTILMFLVIILVIIVKTNNKENYENNIDLVISLTSSPIRLSKIKPVIDCIMGQTLKPTKIVLNLPHVFKRDNTTYDEIPEFITNNKLIMVNRCEDIGPATKIIPTVKLFENPETIIISIDDDVLYRNNFIETMVGYSNRFPEAAITGYTFSRIDNPPEIMKTKCNNAHAEYCEIVEGYSSVLYKKKFLDDFNVSELLRAPKSCYFGDDFYISNYLYKHEIPILALKTDKENSTFVEFLTYGQKEDALSYGANKQTNGNWQNYIECNDYLKEKNQLYIKYFENEDARKA